MKRPLLTITLSKESLHNLSMNKNVTIIINTPFGEQKILIKPELEA
jgi:hypothetical protein